MTPTPVICADTAISLGIGVEEVSAGQTLSFSGCMGACAEQNVDEYFVVIDPTGKVLSVQSFSPLTIVPGLLPVFSGPSSTISCRCEDLFQYTICNNPTYGTWSAIFGIVPGGAPPSLATAISYAQEEVTIVPSGGIR